MTALSLYPLILLRILPIRNTILRSETDGSHHVLLSGAYGGILLLRVLRLVEGIDTRGEVQSLLVRQIRELPSMRRRGSVLVLLAQIRNV